MSMVILKAITGIVFIFIMLSYFAGYELDLFAELLRWGEITVIFFLMSGVMIYIGSQIKNLKKKEGRFYNIVIVISFALTVSAGFLNFANERFAWENILRDFPSFLFEVSDSVISSDSYFKHHPAKKKLALFLSKKVNSDFVPTEEMLKDAGVSFEGFKSMTVKPGIVSSGAILNILNEDDMQLVEPLSGKVTEVSKKVVKVMIPVIPDIKQWYIDSTEIIEKSGADEDVVVNDLYIDGLKVDNSAAILKKRVFEQKPHSFISVVSSDDLANAISDVLYERFKEDMSRSETNKIVVSFLKTGFSQHTPVRGVLRWVFRTIFDPLYATLMAVMLITMIFVLFNVMNCSSYSYSVITVTSIIVMIGFLPNINFVPDFSGLDEWRGPFSSGWTLEVPSLAVYRAVLIGTGAGVIFVYLKKIALFIEEVFKKAVK